MFEKTLSNACLEALKCIGKANEKSANAGLEPLRFYTGKVLPKAAILPITIYTYLLVKEQDVNSVLYKKKIDFKRKIKKFLEIEDVLIRPPP